MMILVDGGTGIQVVPVSVPVALAVALAVTGPGPGPQWHCSGTHWQAGTQ